MSLEPLLTVSLCAWLLSATVPAKSKGSRDLIRAESALARQDMAAACEAWVAMLNDSYPYPQVAFHRLEEWFEECNLRKHVEVLAQAATRLEGPPASVAAGFRVAAAAMYKYGSDEAEEKKLRPMELRPEYSAWFPSSAPIRAALGWTPVSSPPGEGIQSSAIHRSRFCFTNDTPGTRYVEIDLAGPGTVHFNGRPILTVFSTQASGTPQEHGYAAVDAPAGRVCLDVVEAPASAARKCAIRVYPATVVHQTPVGVQVGSAPVGDEGLALAWDWLELKNGPKPGCVDRVLGRGDSSLAWLPLQIELLQSAAYLAPDREDRLDRLLAEFGAPFPPCLVRTWRVTRALQRGQERDAEREFREMDDSCRTSARGMKALAELARARSWDALYEATLERAKEAWPEDCQILTLWYDLQVEKGIYPDPASFAVRCDDVTDRELERKQRCSGPGNRCTLDDGDEQQKDVGCPPADSSDLLHVLWNATWEEKRRLFRTVAERFDEPGWAKAGSNVAREDPLYALMLADALLATGRTQKAREMALVARIHPNTWASTRSAVDRLFFEGRADRYLTDVDAVIFQYESTGFAKGYPQVTVLDEAVLMVDPNGWTTAVETKVTHLVSRDAVEAIGEFSLRAAEELLQLAVRKPDGTWVGPEESAVFGAKDTISLQGLSPQDYLVVRTVTEVPPVGGQNGCFRYPSFIFGFREEPVFLAQVTVLKEGIPLDVMVRGEVEHFETPDGALVFRKQRIAPVAAEPRGRDSLAGLSAVHFQSPCLNWADIRDHFGEDLFPQCDTGMGDPAVEGSLTPESVYERIVNAIAKTKEGFFDKPFSHIIGQGRGNLTLAVYCGLVQSGFDAHLVMVNRVQDQPLDLARPSLEYFGEMVVYVGGKRPIWLHPLHRMVPPGILGRTVRGRPGILLTTGHPRLFVTVPEQPGEEELFVRITGEVGRDGTMTGRMVMRGAEIAGAYLSEWVGDTQETTADKQAQRTLSSFLPSARAVGYRYEERGCVATYQVDFKADLDLSRGDRIALLLPPAALDDVSLAVRKSSLVFNGFMPMRIEIELAAVPGVVLEATAQHEKSDGPFGSVELDVQVEGSKVRIVKTANAQPQAVSPHDYGDFVEFMARVRHMAGMTVGAAIERGDD